MSHNSFLFYISSCYSNTLTHLSRKSDMVEAYFNVAFNNWYQVKMEAISHLSSPDHYKRLQEGLFLSVASGIFWTTRRRHWLLLGRTGDPGCQYPRATRMGQPSCTCPQMHKHTHTHSAPVPGNRLSHGWWIYRSLTSSSDFPVIRMLQSFLIHKGEFPLINSKFFAHN